MATSEIDTYFYTLSLHVALLSAAPHSRILPPCFWLRAKNRPTPSTLVYDRRLPFRSAPGGRHRLTLADPPRRAGSEKGVRKMVEFERERILPYTPAQIWAVLADFENHRVWNPYVRIKAFQIDPVTLRYELRIDRKSVV